MYTYIKKNFKARADWRGLRGTIHEGGGGHVLTRGRWADVRACDGARILAARGGLGPLTPVRCDALVSAWLAPLLGLGGHPGQPWCGC